MEREKPEGAGFNGTTRPSGAGARSKKPRAGSNHSLFQSRASSRTTPQPHLATKSNSTPSTEKESMGRPSRPLERIHQALRRASEPGSPRFARPAPDLEAAAAGGGGRRVGRKRGAGRCAQGPEIQPLWKGILGNPKPRRTLLCGRCCDLSLSLSGLCQEGKLRARAGRKSLELHALIRGPGRLAAGQPRG